MRLYYPGFMHNRSLECRIERGLEKGRLEMLPVGNLLVLNFERYPTVGL